MKDRIALLEEKVEAISSELVAIRHEHFAQVNTVELIGRVSRIQMNIAEIKGDISHLEYMAREQQNLSAVQEEVSQLQQAVSRLQKDMAHLRFREEIAPVRQDLALLRADFARLCYQMSYFATKVDLRGLEVKIKGWMMGGAMAVVSVNFAMNVIFFNFQKEAAAVAAMRTQVAPSPVMPPSAAAPPDR